MNTPFDEEPPTPKKPRMFASLRASFLTGLVVIAPVWLTIWLIWTVIGWVDGAVWPLVPSGWHPDALVNWALGIPRFVGSPDARLPNPDWIEINLRGVGVIVFFVFTIIIGWIAKGLIGRSLIAYAESLVERMPVVRTVYSGIKQISETVFAQSERSFEKACLIQYPRKGIWAIGFISTTAKGEVASHPETANEMLSVFLPTTPNPTSGFLLFVPKEDVIELRMSIEDAAKLVISAGLVYPGQNGSGGETGPA